VPKTSVKVKDEILYSLCMQNARGVVSEWHGHLETIAQIRLLVYNAYQTSKIGCWTEDLLMLLKIQA